MSKSHAARIENSDRLRKTLTALSAGHFVTAREIANKTGSMAVHTDIHELRQNGFKIVCTYKKTATSGRSLPHYQLIEQAGA